GDEPTAPAARQRAALIRHLAASGEDRTPIPRGIDRTHDQPWDAAGEGVRVVALQTLVGLPFAGQPAATIETDIEDRSESRIGAGDLQHLAVLDQADIDLII